MDPERPDSKGLSRAERKRIRQIAQIKSRLLESGLTLLFIDRRYGLPRGTASDTLRNPNLKGERAIAAALGTRPELLWMDRYHASGQRRSVLDYSRPPTLKERQIVTGDAA